MAGVVGVGSVVAMLIVVLLGRWWMIMVSYGRIMFHHFSFHFTKDRPLFSQAFMPPSRFQTLV
jgi:hypothetical protein